MKYKLRAECSHDIEQFKQWMEGDTWNHQQDKDQNFPDVELTFDSALSQEKINSVLRLIPDSHVMIETLKPIEEYTGERT